MSDTSAGPRLLGPAEVRQLAAELDLRPTKQRGQNFVIDPNTVRRIVRESGVGPDDVVVEVGPGLGSLTLALLEVVDPVFSTPAPDPTTFGRPRRGRRRDEPAANEDIQPDYGYDYENEDQSLISIRPGIRVRHPTFGVGTILTVEPLRDDMKLTVRFADIGQKTLRAKFAKLTLA